jgi:hypothetical protein
MSRPFQDALLRGHQAERDWVEEVRDEGRAVAHGKKTVQPKYDPSGQKVQNPDAVALIRVEIKQRDLKFTSPEDFPYDSAFVCNINNEGADRTAPLLYVLRSAPTRCWVWVLGADRNDEWTESTVRDTTRGTTLRMLSCPKSHLRPSTSLMPFLIAHDILHLIDGDTTAFLRPEDQGTATEDRPPRGGKRTTKKKTD